MKQNPSRASQQSVHCQWSTIIASNIVSSSTHLRTLANCFLSICSPPPAGVFLVLSDHDRLLFFSFSFRSPSAKILLLLPLPSSSRLSLISPNWNGFVCFSSSFALSWTFSLLFSASSTSWSYLGCVIHLGIGLARNCFRISAKSDTSRSIRSAKYRSKERPRNLLGARLFRSLLDITLLKGGFLGGGLLEVIGREDKSWMERLRVILGRCFILADTIRTVCPLSFSSGYWSVSPLSRILTTAPRIRNRAYDTLFIYWLFCMCTYLYTYLLISESA